MFSGTGFSLWGLLGRDAGLDKTKLHRLKLALLKCCHPIGVMAAATARHFPSCFTNTRVTRH